MKKFGLLITLFICSCILPKSFGQMEIKLQILNSKFDSVTIQAFDEMKNFKSLYVQPFQNNLIFKDKAPLKPGIYWILGDSTMLDAFMISDVKNQKFSIKIDTNSIVYTGSPENMANHNYVKKVTGYDRQMNKLNDDFKNAQNGGIPQYMLKVYVDSLMAKARRINDQKAAYQRKVMSENKGTLLASVISTTIEIQAPPKEYYQDRSRYQRYYIEHYFDNFPWNDVRIYDTPVGFNKIKDFNNTLYQLDDPTIDTFMIAALNASKVNESSFYRFFDMTEKVLGSIISPYKVEHTYIKMLQNALTYPNLSEARKLQYQKELSYINKNLAGDTVPNFRIVLGNGDTTTLYDIKSNYMLLYLQHPTCPTCIQVRARIANYPALNNAIDNGNLKVLTVYFENDKDVWANYLKNDANPHYLHGWNFDQTIENNNLYDTRTIPYMFLLDKDKRVIKKDILVNEIEDYIQQLGIDR